MSPTTGKSAGWRRGGASRSVGLVVALLLGGCAAAGRVVDGVFHSDKGYRVTLPSSGWRIDPASRADLALKREPTAGGMLVDATCEGREPSRSLDVLTRHLTFGLRSRDVVENGTTIVAGREAARTVVRGRADGREVAVEAVVIKEEPCVHDFLYVAPLEVFESGRAEFRAVVESFSPERR